MIRSLLSAVLVIPAFADGIVRFAITSDHGKCSADGTQVAYTNTSSCTAEMNVRGAMNSQFGAFDYLLVLGDNANDRGKGVQVGPGISTTLAGSGKVVSAGQTATLTVAGNMYIVGSENFTWAQSASNHFGTPESPQPGPYLPQITTRVAVGEGTANFELVSITAVTPTSFTATFQKDHYAGEAVYNSATLPYRDLELAGKAIPILGNHDGGGGEQPFCYGGGTTYGASSISTDGATVTVATSNSLPAAGSYVRIAGTADYNGDYTVQTSGAGAFTVIAKSSTLYASASGTYQPVTSNVPCVCATTRCATAAQQYWQSLSPGTVDTTRTYYAKRLGSAAGAALVTYIGADSEFTGAGYATQQEYLTPYITASKTPGSGFSWWTISASHRPLYSSAGFDANAQNFKPWLNGPNVDMMLHGHIHDYEDVVAPNGDGTRNIHYVTVGNGGDGHNEIALNGYNSCTGCVSHANPNSDYGAALLEVTPRRLYLRAYNTAGAIVHSITVDRGMMGLPATLGQ